MEHPTFLGGLCLAAVLTSASSQAQSASPGQLVPVVHGGRAFPQGLFDVTGQVVGSLCEDIRLRVPTSSDSLREMTVRIDWAALERLQPGEGTQRIHLPIFDRTLELSFCQRDLRGPESYSWLGVIAGSPISTAILVREQDAIQVTLNDPVGGHTWILRWDGPETHALRELDGSTESREWCATDREPIQSEAPPVQAPGGDSSDVEKSVAFIDPGNVVDVLFVPTTEALNWLGSTNAWRAAAQSMVDRFNITSANSSTSASPINLTLRISGIQAGSGGYYEDLDGGTDLRRLTNDVDGYLSEIPVAREAARADIVALVRLNSWDCTSSGCYVGVAWRPRSLSDMSSGHPVSSSDGGFGFSVTSLQYDYPRTFAHEVGHNFGACHNEELADCSGGSITSSPHGYYVLCDYILGNVCSYTTMSYSPGCAFGNFAIPYWSNYGLTVDISGDGCPAFDLWNGASAVGDLINFSKNTLAQNRIGSTLKYSVAGAASAGANGTQANPFPTVTQAMAIIEGGPAEGVVKVAPGTYVDTGVMGGPVTFSRGCLIQSTGVVLIH